MILPAEPPSRKAPVTLRTESAAPIRVTLTLPVVPTFVTMTELISSESREKVLENEDR